MLKLIPFKLNHSLDLLASAHIQENKLTLKYIMNGDITKVSIPNLDYSSREIGLWESTCFEFFLLNEDDKSYYEFNFSPSGKWNCFYFKSKGNPLEEADCDILSFKADKKKNSYEIQIEIDINSLMNFIKDKNEFMMNLTAVIDGNELSYWALGHAEDKPNFHDSNYYRKIKKVR